MNARAGAEPPGGGGSDGPAPARVLAPTGRTAWARNSAPPVRDFLSTEAGGAAVLLGATIAPLLWANSPWSDSYESASKIAAWASLSAIHTATRLASSTGSHDNWTQVRQGRKVTCGRASGKDRAANSRTGQMVCRMPAAWRPAARRKSQPDPCLPTRVGTGGALGEAAKHLLLEVSR